MPAGPRTLAALAAILLGYAAYAALPDAVEGQPLPSLAPMLDRTTAGVVNVATFARVRTYDNPLMRDPFFRRFFRYPPLPQERRRAQSAGSGVVVDAKAGYIVTNHHLVDGAHEIHVTLSDGRGFPATLVGVDAPVDLAVLRIDADDLTELTLADSQMLRVGDFVVAIGNPFGLQQTVTSGIVSALGRSGLGIEGYENFIQTDASINPGNSGGALVDLNGRLVGINTAIVAPSGGNVGIGFAIPSDMVSAVMGELIEHGVVRRGRIGMTVAALNPKLAELHGLAAREGLVVTEVVPGSAADSAGIRPGDILARVDGRAMDRPADYGQQEAITMVGDELEMEIVRDRRKKRLAVSIERNWSVAGGRIHERLEGTVLMDVFHEDEPVGIYVSSIDRDSPAWQTGFRAGDTILAINNVTTRHIGELARRIGGVQRAVVRLRRDDRFGDLRF
ncbi:MAG: Do family serine endopeptidase [Gammaproteobacteria bacterium]|nr:Do family serine endopeptidase [Gammaproteobacteria bacterium]